MLNAYSITVRGVVQGVGFRPFVYRLARTNGLTGWVLNEQEGVEIHLEGEEKTAAACCVDCDAASDARRARWMYRVFDSCQPTAA
jgi:hydrogenase maturation factor HypF (carbamoyltransferase family)